MDKREKHISPEAFLNYAKENHSKYDKNHSEKSLINIYGCISKGFCCQVEEYFDFLKGKIQIPKNLNGFREKFYFILRSEMSSPLGAIKLYDIRNELEHEYRIKSYDAAEPYILSLESFILTIKRAISEFPNNIDSGRKSIYDKISEDYSESTKRNYRYQIQKFLEDHPKDSLKLTEEEAHNYLEYLSKNKEPPSNLATMNGTLKYLYTKILGRDYSLHPKFSRKRNLVKYEKLNSRIINNILEKNNVPESRLLVLIVWELSLQKHEIENLKIEKLLKLELSKKIHKELINYVGDRKSGFIFSNKEGDAMSGRYLQKKLKEGLPVSYKHLTLRHLRQVSPNKEGKLRRSQLISRGDFKKILNEIKGEKDRDLFYFIYEFGIGLEQFKKIKKEDIIPQNKKLRLRKTKNYNRTSIWLKKTVFERLMKYVKNNHKENKPLFIQSRQIQKILKKAIKDAGVSKIVNYRVLSNSLKDSRLHNI